MEFWGILITIAYFTTSERHAYTCQDFGKYGKVRGVCPYSFEKSLGDLSQDINITGIVARLVFLQRAIEELWIKTIGKVVRFGFIMQQGIGRAGSWPTLSSWNCQLSMAWLLYSYYFHGCLHIICTQREFMELASYRHGDCICGHGFSWRGFWKYKKLSGLVRGFLHSKNCPYHVSPNTWCFGQIGVSAKNQRSSLNDILINAKQNKIPLKFEG